MEHSKPDIVLFNSECWIIDKTHPFYFSLKGNEREKSDKYNDLKYRGNLMEMQQDIRNVSDHLCSRNGTWKSRGMARKDWYQGRLHHATEKAFFAGDSWRGP